MVTGIVLFGPPGAGKGTQSALLKSKLSMSHISTGDLFRENMKKKTPLGIEAQKYLDDGKLVPDSITIGMVDDVLKKLEGRNFVLDGFPRTAQQADALESLVKKNGFDLKRAVFLDVPKTMLMGRLTGRRICEKCGESYHIESKAPKQSGVCDKCGGKLIQRPDDREEVIATRLQAYENSTKPLRDYYRQKGKYIEVNGVGETEDIFGRIEKAIS
ncbi:MAG: adenylate kinase [Bdellovibrionia bacterium]